jgi:hypothetical protein
MKKKIVWSFIVLVLLVCIYEVIFRIKTVTYIGEDNNWMIKINAKLVQFNGSYRIEVQYKGKESIENINFNIHPHYGVGSPSLDKNGYYLWECNDDCGFYDKDSKLIFFIVWKEENKPGEIMKLIDLRKISN